MTKRVLFVERSGELRYLARLSTYNAYLIPDGVQEYSYTKKDGTEFNGFQFKFNMEFPKKEDK